MATPTSKTTKSFSGITSHRLEAFCDGVIAIAITLLVLEIKVPTLEHGDAASLKLALISKWPLVLATVLSFVAIGTHWLNHRHFLRLLNGINHGFILITLFWLLGVCLIPFPTAVLGETMLHGDSIYVAAPLYLASLALPSFAWALSWWYAGKCQLISPAIGDGQRARLGNLFYLSVIVHCFWVGLSFLWPWLALVMGTVQVLTYLRPLALPLIISSHE